MAVTTLASHVNRAISFMQGDKTYFAIAKTTPWEDPINPDINDENFPEPNPADTTLDGVIGFKKVETKHLVVRDDENGTIAYRDSKWRIVPMEQAHIEGAKDVYMESWIFYDELPTETYRQEGLYTNLQVAEGVLTSKYNLLPSEVADYGNLEVINNHKPAPRDKDLKEKLSIILEF